MNSIFISVSGYIVVTKNIVTYIAVYFLVYYHSINYRSLLIHWSMIIGNLLHILWHAVNFLLRLMLNIKNIL